ncbi:hypothetical protein AWM70_09970 [Paenibacillus yonginensis]|uniref:Uncharacterized protein n=1 Tax=Paenibacillus yonginensis TaxID=1462996 RepID=A0A1B1N0C7_9BACL|nr:hypothetical protein [Paenibacillus yonginensis]ANS74884.1 hypothetical protein AWM70_09970 [Paenibacillus yonginensis]
MSQKLSRVERLGKRNDVKAEKKSRRRAHQPLKQEIYADEEILLNTAVYEAAAARMSVGAGPVDSVPKREKPSVQVQGTFNPSGPSRQNQAGTAVRGRRGGARPAASLTASSAASEAEPEVEEVFPPRTELYPSHRIKWTRWFFNVLLVIFIGLTVWLLWWGFHSSPWAIKQGN